MADLLTSMSFIGGDPEILPYSFIQDQDPNRSNFASGQIKTNTNFGKKILEIAKNNEYKNYLEVGTWCGLGTTKCLLDGIILRNDNSKLLSIESNEKFFRITKQYWDRFFFVHKIDKNKFSPFYGSLVKYDDLDDNYVTDSGMSKETYDYNQDIKDAPFIEIEEDVDVVCLDGGHFSSSIEWDMFKDKSKVFILDDTKTSKTRTILDEIKTNNDTWSIVYESDDRNGEMIIIREVML